LIQTDLIESGPLNARILRVTVGKKQFVTPTYFPAISKKEIRDPEDEFLELVTSFRYPRLLVSAYDYGRLGSLSQRRAVGRLSDYYRRGSIILLDSGVFESYWRGDDKWTFRRYRESVKNVDSDLYFSFDPLPSSGKANKDAYRELTLKRVSDSFKLANGNECVPIVHAKDPAHLTEFVADLVKKESEMFRNLAISERELGSSISERTVTVKKLRKLIGGRKGGLLHILGCGNPVSMAAYSYAGADTYDSLDWALSSCNPFEDTLVDYSHLELLGCKCKVCRTPSFKPPTNVFLHNLLFYQNYSLKLQTMIRQGTLRDYLLEMGGKQFQARIDRNH
jgi:queuine/archaeosine tRNA-ribosyltransferase